MPFLCCCAGSTWLQDVVPFGADLRVDPRLQPAPQRSNASPLLSAQNSPIRPFHADSAWPQHTQTTTTATDPSMAVTAMRDRLNSALEPLRSASPLVPELAEPRPPPPTMRQSRNTAPTLPPLRTQLQNTTAWDDLSPYRMLFFGPSGSIANGVVQENIQEDRPAHDNINLNHSRVPPPTFWEGGLYPFAALNPPSFTNNNNRDRELVSQDPRGTAALQPPVESDIPFPSAAQPLAPLPHPAIIFDDLEIGAHHSSLEEPSSRNHPQQLSSSSSESLARSSLEGYLSSEEWLPSLRRRSAWRLLDSDEEERLPMDARRFRMLAERREAAAAAARAGRQDVGSLLESTEPRPWIDIEADRRSTAAANRLPDPMLRSNPAPAERPERARFWDDAGDRVSGGAMEYDNYDNWLRSEPRTDLSQRLERLAGEL
ncbi:hypothetical protein M378DRAFT_970868 [Amanita muscaria Koide BX008]|uniref:Uncharacterized protein n=1 Tax=Amanita muscaria (strain Koide BX008) TaxID=946122 RepID=A0A0C2WTT3_AMAMK|nr:hypothetical protein M378DRAFT_970868 [Amanita muscaria Koide BX008]